MNARHRRTGWRDRKTAVKSMQGTPLGIALLVVNLAFLAFVAYVLGEIAENSESRNRRRWK